MDRALGHQSQVSDFWRVTKNGISECALGFHLSLQYYFSGLASLKLSNLLLHILGLVHL